MGGLGATRPWRAMFAVALTALALGAAADAAADGWTLEVLEPAGAVAGTGAREGGELQLSAGQALRLRCEGPERPRWLFPAAEEGEVDEPLLPKVEEQAPPATPPAGSAPARWAATLHLPNASYYHTGAYACVRHAHPPKHLVDIYVYVADPEYPWVRSGVVATWARQHEEAVLDCRPNNRSLHVKLLDGMDKEVPMGLNEERGWTARWSPRLGFTLEPMDIRDAYVFFCDVPGTEDDLKLMMMVNVLPQRKVFPRDVNMNNTEWMVNTWDKLILRCDFEGLPRPTISWYKDSEPFAPPGGEQFRLQDGNQTLVIGFVTEADQGEYRCRAANRLHSEERWVRVQLRLGETTLPSGRF